MSRTEKIEVTKPSAGLPLTPPWVATSLRRYWASHEERDVDPMPDTARGKRALDLARARAARRWLDGGFGANALRGAERRERRELLSIMLSASLDLRAKPAADFATAVFEEAEADELTAAALVRGAEAAARTGRVDLLVRTKSDPPPALEKAASVLELVAARLERAGDVDSAQRLREAL